MNGNSETIAEPTVDSGWGYCTDDCRGDRKKKELTKPIQSGVGVGGRGYLQITNIDVLQGADCLTMCKKSTLVPHTQVLVRGINSTKVMDLDKQVGLDSNSFSEKCLLFSSLLTFTLLVSILLLLLLQRLFSSCVPVLLFSLQPPIPFYFLVHFFFNCASPQLCAGLKIRKKPPPFFFAYSGLGPNMTFRKLKYPLKDWKPAHLEVRRSR